MILLCSKDGYLFDKEVILQYIITKKNEYHRKLKEYERLKKNEEEELLEKASEETDEKIKNFLKAENNIVSKPVNAFVSDEPSTSSVSNMANGKDKELPSFWVPSKTPSVKKNALQKPVKGAQGDGNKSVLEVFFLLGFDNSLSYIRKTTKSKRPNRCEIHSCG